MNGGHMDLIGIFVNWFPMLLLIAVWLFFLRKMQARGGLADYQKRKVEALERIAAALEKRAF